MSNRCGPEQSRSRSVNGSGVRPLFALMLLGALALAGCGSRGGVIGTYVYQSDSPDAGPGSITLELKGDNKAVVTIKGAPGDASLPSVEGTWTQEGDKITTVLNGDKDVYTLKNGDLTINAFGDDIVLKKQ